MKYVQVPKDIQIMVNGKPWVESNGEVMKPWSMSRYLENVVLADPAAGTTYKDLKACFVVEKKFENAIPGKYVELEDTHWEKLKNTIEEPKGGGIPPSVLRQLIPFMDAILGAKSEKA